MLRLLIDSWLSDYHHSFMYFPPYFRYFLCIRLWNKVDEGFRVTWLCAPWTGTVGARRTRSSCSQASSSTVTSTCTAPTCAPWPPPWSWPLGDTERGYLELFRLPGKPMAATEEEEGLNSNRDFALVSGSVECDKVTGYINQDMLAMEGRRWPPSQLERSQHLWLSAWGTRAGQWPCGAVRVLVRGLFCCRCWDDAGHLHSMMTQSQHPNEQAY